MRNWLCCIKSCFYCCSVKLCLPLPWCYGQEPARLLCQWDFPEKNTGMGCISFSRRSSLTRDWSHVSWLAGRFFTIEPQVKPHLYIYIIAIIISTYYCCSFTVMSNSLWPHELQHARLPCPSLSLRVCSDLFSLNWWCHPTSHPCHPLLFLPSVFPIIRVFPNESAFCIRWAKYWSLNLGINPSNEYSGLVSLRIDWFDLLAVKELSRVFAHG